MKNLHLFLLFLMGITQHAVSQTVTGVMTQIPCNNDGIYTVTTSGIPLPITYTYYVDGAWIVHANVNSATDQLTNVGMSASNFIYCNAYGGNVGGGTQNSYTPEFAFALGGTSPTCPVTLGTLTATQVSGTPGPFSYSWTNAQTLITYPGNNAAAPAGHYGVEITDQTTGCVLQINDTAIYIEQLSTVMAAIHPTAANCTNGTATAIASGGLAPYTYLWANGATSAMIDGLSPGYYPLVVTDAQGCQSNYLGAYIEQATQITVHTTTTDATCLQMDGSAIASSTGGVAPYTYAWSNGQTGGTATHLSGGNYYTVITTDANGCLGQGNVYISTNTPVNVSVSSSFSQCVAPTGSAALSVSGGTAPYTYAWIYNPLLSGSTLTNVGPGSYYFRVTDAVGCVNIGSVYVPPVSTVYAEIEAPEIICPATTGVLTTNVSGSNAPFTYLWNNAETTEAISGVPVGVYTCVITDALGCSVTKSKELNVISPLQVGVSTAGASCVYSADGSASPIVIGGVAPYTYAYSNGTTTANTNTLEVGSYYLTVADANGCSKSTYFAIANDHTSEDCYCTISGTVYVDGNADCVLNTGEHGVEGIRIHCSGFGYTFTNEDGNYSFRVPTGTYTISEQVNPYYPLSACQSNSNAVSVVAAAGCNTAVNFSSGMIEIHDLKITTVNATIRPIPGNDYQQKVIVKNLGTITESGIQLGYKHDGQLSFANASSPDFVQLNSAGAPYAYSIQSGFPSLSANGTDVMLLNFNTPTNIPLGTAVNFYDTVTNVAPIEVNWLLDNTPWNNVSVLNTTVIGSYDPNYKEVSPAGEGAAGIVSMETKEFDYTIHFQNEGTYFAQNIVVTDQLDADLDWSTFKPGYSDYEYSTTMSETGLITFTFANINLPWKNSYGDVLSSALVNYSIQRKTTTPVGTEFTNTADIYFDYNAPITTNTTLNTLGESVAGVDEIAPNDVVGITVDLYPVPASDYLNIRVNNLSKSESATVSIIDLMGKVVLSDQVDLSAGSTLITENLSKLMTGTYLTRIQFENGSAIVRKIVLYND